MLALGVGLVLGSELGLGLGLVLALGVGLGLGSELGLGLGLVLALGVGLALGRFLWSLEIGRFRAKSQCFVGSRNRKIRYELFQLVN